MKQRSLFLFLLVQFSTALAWETPPAITTCIDYHCDYRRPVTLSRNGWEQVRARFIPAANSAAQERQQIKSAIATMEQLVGKKNGTWRDLQKNDGEGSELGQLDCIAESLNTTQYLQLMAQDNLLKWHRVSKRQKRDPWFFSVHWTAVIDEIESQTSYAVDAWVNANGEPPVIQPIADWLLRKETGTEQDK